MAATMFSMIPRRTLAISFAGAMLLGSAACSDSGSNADVTAGLAEYTVALDPSDPGNGELEVEGKNNGTITHEMVIVRAASADDLPTDADGAVDETQIPEDDVMGEIEDIEKGKSATKKFDLSAGNYVVFCNITEDESDGSVLSHFAEGMHANLAVS